MSEPFYYGGQAVIEGVMMRGRTAMAVAVRHPGGQVVVHTEPLDRGVYRSPWAKRPFLRGVLLLWDTLVLGMRALTFSATVASSDGQGTKAEDEGRVTADESPSALRDSSFVPRPPSADAREAASEAAQTAFGGGALWGTMAVALTFGVGLFFVLPLLAARLVDPVVPAATLSVVLEGLVRMGLFFGYVWLIGRVPDVQRVFQYHGAEHKTINAFEAGEPLDPLHAQRYGVAHPRCGTSFLLYVVLLSILVFALLGRPPLAIRIASRIVLVPVIAALAYELIRLAARYAHRRAVRILLAPGMALQAMTTREPDDSQVEVAIAALDHVLARDSAGIRHPDPAAARPAVALT